MPDGMNMTYTERAFGTVVGMMLLVLLLISNVAAHPPAKEWNRTFGDRGDDWASDVQQTSDGGYVLAGQGRFNHGEERLEKGIDSWLIKTDANGSEQWNRTFGGTMDDRANSVQQTKDGGYILAGATASYSSVGSDTDAWLIKTDANGTQQWQKTFGRDKDDQANSVQQTADGGYILAGRYSYTENNFEAWLIKTDTNGSEQWNKTFADDEEANSVVQTPDGGYILAGKTHTYRKGNRDLGSNAFLIKTDAGGKLKWRKTFGKKEDETFTNSVHQTQDGGYILAGDRRSDDIYHLDETSNFDVWLVKTDANGSERWSKTFRGAGNDEADSVQQTNDGGYILAGRFSYSPVKWAAWLIKTDASGSEQWNETFGGIENDQINSVRQTADGGYILAGLTRSYGNGSADAWLIKVSGDPPSIEAKTPIATPNPNPTPNPIPAPISTATLTPTALTAETVAPKTPGFEAMPAIAVMLTIAYFFRKNKNLL